MTNKIDDFLNNSFLHKFKSSDISTKESESITITCDDCGTDKDVYETVCPFTQEIHDEIVDCNLCKDCEYERAMDI